jgi:hypothetical protein
MNDKAIIKVGICVAYDWPMLRLSLPRIYKSAQLICLGLDKNRNAWSGERFNFDDDAFYSFVREIDSENKIVLYEDTFFKPTLNKRDNCNRHRTLIAEKMGLNGWHIQVDADEYFVDFDGFVNYLLKLDDSPTQADKPINVCCPFVPLIKRVAGGYLYVNFQDTLPEFIPMATNRPDYQRARQNGHFNHLTPYYVIHETWARDEQELWFKINNWGHASEELEEKAKRESYFNLWKSLDQYNYHYVKNVHPVKPDTWPALGFCEGQSADDFMRNFSVPEFPLSHTQLTLRNNRNLARIKSVYKKLFAL